MDIKNHSAKIVSFFLIANTIYQTILSVNAIFFIYPRLNFDSQNNLIIQEGLVERAIILYATIVVGGIYGSFLLLRPSNKLKVIHVISGILIFIFSIFYVVRTPFTDDPLQRLIFKLIKAG